MNNKKQDIENLVRKLLDGEISMEEEKELNTWYNQNQDEPIDIPEEFAGSEKVLRKRMLHAIQVAISKKKSVIGWPRIALAAAVTGIIISVGIWFLNKSTQIKQIEQVTHAHDVAPGRQRATLILAGGKKIQLTEAMNGELAKEAGVVITKSKEGLLIYEIKDQAGEVNKTNTLSTEKGETYQVRLPDGSLVWLNSASSLTYPADLIEHGKRVVKLRGEGYFEVAKDSAHPFVVESKGQQIEVLGTQFNINAYENEPVATTTLLEGSVRLRAWGHQKLLKPGQQALHRDGIVQIERANVESVVDWKEGDFYFNRIDFKTAMRKIERWYNVEMIYDTSVPEDLETGGWISRNKSLSTVLKFIESSGLVRFKIEGKKVYVFK